MAEIVIPSVGIAMEEALVVKWLKEPGDDVAADEPVAEIETDKATMDLESPVDGRLGPHLFEPGAVVPVGTVVVEVLAAGDEAAPAPPAGAPGLPEPAASRRLPSAALRRLSRAGAADERAAAHAQPARPPARAGRPARSRRPRRRTAASAS